MGILSVSDVGSDASLGQEDSPEDWNLDVGVRWEADSDTGTVRSEVLESLLVGAASRGSDDGAMWTKSVRCGSLDGLDNVLFILEVDPLFSAEFLHKLFLLGASIDGDYADTPDTSMCQL